MYTMKKYFGIVVCTQVHEKKEVTHLYYKCILHQKFSGCFKIVVVVFQNIHTPLNRCCLEC